MSFDQAGVRTPQDSLVLNQLVHANCGSIALLKGIYESTQVEEERLMVMWYTKSLGVISMVPFRWQMDLSSLYLHVNPDELLKLTDLLMEFTGCNKIPFSGRVIN